MTALPLTPGHIVPKNEIPLIIMLKQETNKSSCNMEEELKAWIAKFTNLNRESIESPLDGPNDDLFEYI